MKIEKGVPMPHGVTADQGSKYPFKDMGVGDSVFVQGQNSQGLVAVAARNYGFHHGWKFSCRTDENGVRIWRVK
jgi:hypothetical protein